MANATLAATATSGSNQPSSWGWLKSLNAWIANSSSYLYGMWNSGTPGLHPDGSVTPGEGGVDLGAPMGTPVYALATGPIVGVGQWNDGEHQVLTQRVNVPGYGPQDLYYQHLYLNSGFKQGQVVQKGQQIGTVGSFNETEVGFNAAWGGIWGSNHPGPWVKDPRPLLKALVQDKAPSVSPDGTSITSFNLTDPTTWLPALFPTLKQWGEYIAIFVISIILIIVGFYLIAQKSIVQAGKDAMGAAKAAVV